MVEFILSFIKANLYDIVTVLVAILVLGYLWYRGQKKIVYRAIYGLVSVAEKQFGGGTGAIKFSFVVAEVYKLLPTIAKLFLSEKQLDNMIEDAVARLKNFLEHEGNIAGYDEEQRG